MVNDDPNRARGTKRDRQLEAIRKAARKESWITMLLRRRREDKGKPKRQSPLLRPWFRKKD